MKNWNYKSLLFILGLGIFVTSCTDDGGSTDNGPTVTLESGSGIISADATVNVGQEFTVSVKGTKTNDDMKTLTVNVDGVKANLADLSIAGNPLLLVGTDATSFTKNIQIKAHSSIGAKSYSFVVEDTKGNKSTKSIKITTGTPPTLVLTGSENISVGPDALFATNFKVTPGTSNLSTVEVLIDGVAVAKERCFYGESTAFSANPHPIPSLDQSLFQNKIVVRTPAVIGTYKYTYIFTDATGLSASQVINVIVGTPLTILEGVLLNQSGPINTGGLDLDTGAGVGSNNTTGDIRDMGIDLGLPTATNWKQRIAGINGAEIRTIKKGANGVPETFSFSNIAIAEDISALWDKGGLFTASEGNIKVSDKVAKDDVFIVKRGTKYYLINTKDVKIVINDNSDQYTFDVKF